MHTVLLVSSLLLSWAFSLPLYSPPLNNSVETHSVLSENGYTLKSNDILKNFAPVAQPEESKDLTGQETFYPSGGIWWGVRPWGGWGGYRPWYGWHGWPGWHSSHWGGHWGGNWGGRWGRGP